MPDVIGITGQFGSGCTTLRDVISQEFNFIPYTFSQFIKEKASSMGIRITDRYVLQNIGNQFRKRNLSYWAEKIIKEIRQDKCSGNRYVVDGFRNVREITLFRKTYGKNFYLIAMNVDDIDERWRRVKLKYKHRKFEQFEREDSRDRGERFPYGQQVVECVYHADIVLDNSKTLPSFEKTVKKHLKSKVTRYVNLILGDREICQSNERRMQVAFLASQHSTCIKRKVGAAIFNKRGKMISVGYNKPPFRSSCIKKFDGCHKDLMHRELWKGMWDWVSGKTCPKCKSKLKNLRKKRYCCSYCGFDVKGLLVPTKGSEHCVALHAEERAILNAKNKNLKKGRLYTTTFPCLQCALKIVLAGISAIYYVDPYPLPETRWINDDLFKRLNVKKFEGIKSLSAYKRLFKNRKS